LRQIARVVPAIATEETHYYLNGICIWHVADWTWRFGATDGHRLMLVDLPLPDATGTIPNGTILPSRFIKLWMRLFQRCGDPIKITFGPRIERNHPDGTMLDLPGGAMRFAASSTFGAVQCAITTKLIDGTYPDVERVVPKEALSVARFDRQGLLQAINAVGAMADGKLRAIKLTFDKDIATVSLAMSEAHSQMVIPCRHNCRDGARPDTTDATWSTASGRCAVRR
jgi:DNA polymerase-3 subunit beta